MAVLKAVNTTLSFLLELAMLAAFAYWGYHAVDNPVLRWVAAIGLPAAVAVVWGFFLAPRAARRANRTVGVVASLALFCLAALALFITAHPVLGTVMVVLAIINRALLVLWDQW